MKELDINREDEVRYQIKYLYPRIGKDAKTGKSI